MLKTRMNKYLRWMPVLSAILLWLAWPPFISSPLLFIALIPLLYFDYQSRIEGYTNKAYWIQIFYGLFTWNALTTWWIWNATEGGAVATLILNSIFMTIPFMLHHSLWKLSGGRFSYLPLLIFYTGFEYFHHNWDISWPWLTLGNGFARTPGMVQWYEYTGSLGGSIWIWITNILLLGALLSERKKRKLSITAAIIVLPLILSFVIESKYRDQDATIKVDPLRAVIVQPNFDPYEEKFSNGSRWISPEMQLERMLALAEEKLDSNTELIVFPETSITDAIPEEGEAWRQNDAVIRMQAFIRSHPHLKILSGADTYLFYRKGQKPSSTARKSGDELYFDVFNSAVLLDSNSISIYHKSKLVPGVELMPYPAIFGYIDLGGIAGNLGRQEESEVFDAGNFVAAPVICYESIYSDYLSSYIRKGADLIVIMTNDGWWADTDGYKQHLHYARLRAIETRREILRSANTGISCSIDRYGEIHDPQGWWVPASLNIAVARWTGITFYVKYGDLIGPTALWGSGALVVYLIILFIKRRRDKEPLSL